MLKVRSHSSRLCTTMLPPPPTPALLNNRWIRSVAWACATSSQKRATCAGSETSAIWVVTRSPCANPAASHSWRFSPIPSGVTSHIATLHASAASSRTSSRPIPDPPPVTTAIRPASSFIAILPRFPMPATLASAPFLDRASLLRGRGLCQSIGERRRKPMADKPTVIALEEHYLDPEVRQHGSPGAGPDIVRRLDDLSDLRLKEMDAAGIDLQVLSHTIPGLQAVDAAAAPRQRSTVRGRAAPSRPLCRIRGIADRRSACGRRRTRAQRYPARLQGGDDQRHDRRPFPRRPPFLADLRTGAGA